MKKIKKGVVRISDDLCIHPQYTFEEFKKTRYYKNQNGIRVIRLEEQQNINGRKYFVNLFFRNGKIYILSLLCCDKEYTEATEKMRKLLHDEILEQLGVICEEKFEWGKISSDYDSRSNCSSINVVYY